MITAEELRRIQKTEYNNYKNYLDMLLFTKNEEIQTKLIKAAEDQLNSIKILIETEPIPQSKAIDIMIPEVIRIFYTGYGFKEVSISKYHVLDSKIVGIELYFNWEETKKK